MDFYFLQNMLVSQLLINILLIQEDTLAISFNDIDAIVKVEIMSLKLIAFASVLKKKLYLLH